MDQNKSDKLVYAGFRIRTLATLIDMVITAPFFIAIIYLLGQNEYTLIRIDDDFYSQLENINVSASNRISDIISWVISISYSVFFISSKKQATIGKRVCEIYVATKDGHKLGKLRALARFFASILSVLLLGIGFIMIAFTKEKTALHDLICGTRVFRGKIN